MQPGDFALFYHSGKEKAAVGVMEVTRGWRPDGADRSWASVAVRPVASLTRPVALKAMKAEARLAGMEMLRQSRLSVSPIDAAQWDILMAMSGS